MAIPSLLFWHLLPYHPWEDPNIQLYSMILDPWILYSKPEDSKEGLQQWTHLPSGG